MTAVSPDLDVLLNSNFGVLNYLLGFLGVEGPKWLGSTRLTCRSLRSFISGSTWAIT